jgi:predicted component of type VI protein secretion system
MKLNKKEFADLKHGGMTVNEYLNSFIQLSRYAPDDINTDEKKQDVFLIRLNDDIQFQLLNTDYTDFQHMVDKAVVIENKIKKWRRMARGRCHSLDSPLEAMLGLASCSLTSFSSHSR